MCLAAMEKVVCAGESLWDVGCGSGILSVAACRLGASPVRATDVDPQAIEATRDNLERNGLSGKVELLSSEGMEQETHDAWHVVVSNVHLEYILADGQSIFHALKEGGRWILSGFLAEQGQVVRTLLSDLGFLTREWVAREEWGSAVAEKPVSD